METWCIDDLQNSRESLLDGLKAQTGAHYHTPPTMAGRVRMFKEAPELHFPILFLHAATAEKAELMPLIGSIQAGTVIYGETPACAAVLEAAQCEAQPLYFHEDRLAVRVV
jgi:hypothetical protein